MRRSAKIAIVVHCILNVNSKVEGLAKYEGVHPLISALADRGYGIMQLRCPEMTSHGMKRWAQSVEQYDTPAFREHCARIAEDAAGEVKEYIRNGYSVGPMIGFEGSPSCGVTSTCSADWGGLHDPETTAKMMSSSERVDGSGILVRELVRWMEPLGVSFIAVDDREGDGGVARIIAELEEC